MRRQTCAVGGLVMLVTLFTGVAGAADSDQRVAREREMLRRAQEALRESQSENSDLAHAKLQAEQKLKTAADQLESAAKASKSAQASLRTQLQNAAAVQADLAHQLEEAKQQLAALGAKQKETAAQLGTRETELTQMQQQLETSRAANSSCEAKNLKLYEYSRAVLEQYQRKGVWSALTQKEPVFGFKEVGIENTVQEYQEKFDSQRISQPAAQVAKPVQR